MNRTYLVPVVSGVIAALLTGLYLAGLEMTYKKGAQRVPVLVAAKYIDQGTMIDETMVEERMVPKEFAQPKTLRLRADVALKDGRRVFMTLVPIEKGEQIAATKLSPLGAGTGIASIIPTDRRAVTLLIDGEMVNGIVKPGNRVDIIGIFQFEDAMRRTSEGAYTVLQNVLVLAVGHAVLGMPSVASKMNARDTGETDTGKTAVSFSVTPSEAALLTLTAERGTVRLSLRPTGDATVLDLRVVKLQDVGRDIPAAARTYTGEPAKNDAFASQRREALELLRKYQHQQP